ncbi:hypothetical protein UVI_02055420 [Ustilaginoidea virens]|uniref:Dihydrolipoamide acetyltransferase component of pyruvate dehydrogenase complex n=1 Tax=Ustilaginoidea virens TaxID=1159556 RepID=A0A1B5KU12_USTVR|nr:hypothetical protein UVI_02055420 [Ustilaginoidea virens]
MFLQRGSRVLRRQLQTSKLVVGRSTPSTPRWFTESRRLYAVKPVLLADIGEGIVECEVIQWFVQPGARVEEFSPLCEVQSDKASVEITSRFSGTVKKLHYEAGDMAKVGKPFVDIDIEGEAEPGAPAPPPPSSPPTPSSSSSPSPSPAECQPSPSSGSPSAQVDSASNAATSKPKGKMATLATPAIRHLSRELRIDIADIDGTGRDGRVLKEDIFRFVKSRDQVDGDRLPTGTPPPPPPPPPSPGPQTETRVSLSQTQQMMFKSMTRSLTIPHFLYADEIDFSHLVALRARLNKVLLSQSVMVQQDQQPRKLSYLPFIIKAVSMALYQFPVLNARVDADASSNKPSLIMRSQHNIGVAMDTPQGLLVPVIKDVGSRNILSVAAELARLQELAHEGKLSPGDMSGGTITVSNIGNIGGTYLSPVIVDKEVSILGIGRMRTVPAFDENDAVVKKHVCNFSWSADHRVVDGATMARAAEVVRRVVEEPDIMVMHLR